MRKILVILCFFTSVALFLSGCAYSTPTQRGAASGAVSGAVAGQIIGKNTKSTMIGAGVGALGGALVNDARHSYRYR